MESLPPTPPLEAAANPTNAVVVPLHAEEIVAPRRSTNATATPTTTPLPPTSVPTANPRQRFAEPPVAPAAASALPSRFTVTPPEQRLRVPPDEEEGIGGGQHTSQEANAALAVGPQTPSPVVPAAAEGSHPPPSVRDTAVKRPPEHAESDAGVTQAHSCLVSGAEGEESETPLVARSNLLHAHLEAARDPTETSPSPDPIEEDVPVPAAQPQKVFAAPNAPAITAHIGDALAYRPITRSASPGQALGQYDGLALSSVQQVLEAKHRVYRICLTGGPCAGKSTMLSAMQAKIPQRLGFRVMCVPEAATLLVTGGMQWDGSIAVAQQSALLRTQLALEDQFYALAVASGVPTIIVSDRGTMDGRAFCTDAQFEEILRGVGCTIDVLRDRYDAVLHMVTSANGAEEFYNLDNPARYEDLDGARASDLRLQEMYVGHHMFRLLDNSTSFEDKIERGLQVVAQVVHKEQSAPAAPSYYLVRRCSAPLPVASASYTTYTTVLNNSQMNDIRLLVRREMSDGSSMHFFKSVKDVASLPPPSSSLYSTPRAMSRVSGGASLRSSIGGGGGGVGSHNRFSAPSQQRIERAQRISSREYNSLKQHRDRARAEVVMEATHFIFGGANYELTTLLAPSWAAGRQTLTVENAAATTAGQSGGPAPALKLPPFLEVDREVPVESLTTTFLISHRETGALYTSLAFAPVFSRAVVTALGAHADTENILNSTLSTPRGPSALRGETNSLVTSPVVAEKVQQQKPALQESVAEHAPAPLPIAPAASVRRGLTSIDINTAPHGVSVLSKSASKRTLTETRPPHEVAPFFLGGSVSMQQPRNVVTPSGFSLSGAEEGGAEAGEHPQPERRVVAHDPFGVLPPIESKRHPSH